MYEFEKRTQSQVVQTNRRLFGYIDRSNRGEYTYVRKGTLSPYNVERLTKGVLITDEINQRKVHEILHKQGTKKIKRYFLTISRIIG